MNVQSCANCDAKANKICSGCKKIHYCSQTCQRAHWKIHKKQCRLIRKREGKKKKTKKSIRNDTLSSMATRMFANKEFELYDVIAK